MGVEHPILLFFLVVVASGVAVLLIVARLVGRILQGVVGPFIGRSRRVLTTAGSTPANVVRFCSNTKCRHPNRPGARFCGQCGRRL